MLASWRWQRRAWWREGAEALIIPAEYDHSERLCQSSPRSRRKTSWPIFHSIAFAYNDGATVSAGPTLPTTQGGLVGSILAGHLDGSLDIASTGIGVISQMTVNINQDAADMQGVSVSEALMELAFLRDSRWGWRPTNR